MVLIQVIFMLSCFICWSLAGGVVNGFGLLLIFGFSDCCQFSSLLFHCMCKVVCLPD